MNKSVDNLIIIIDYFYKMKEETLKDNSELSTKAKGKSKKSFSRLSQTKINPSNFSSLQLKKIMEDITFENFIELLKVPAKLRTENQRDEIMFYLKTQNMLDLFIKNKASELDENSIFLCFANNMELQLINKDEILFRINDYANKFFIILKGKIDILVPYKKKVNFSSFEYFKYLEQLLFEGETGLIKIILDSNYEKFSFENYSEFFDYAKVKAKITLGLKIKSITDDLSLQKFYKENIHILKIFKFVQSFDEINFFRGENFSSFNLNIENIHEEPDEIFSSNSEKDSSFSNSEDEKENKISEKNLNLTAIFTSNDKVNEYDTKIKKGKENNYLKSCNRNLKIKQISELNTVKFNNKELSNLLNNNNINRNCKHDNEPIKEIHFDSNEDSYYKQSEYNAKGNKRISDLIITNNSQNKPYNYRSKSLKNFEKDFFSTENSNKLIHNSSNKQVSTRKSDVLTNFSYKNNFSQQEEFEKEKRFNIENKFNLTEKEQVILKRYSLMDNQSSKFDYVIFTTSPTTLEKKEFLGDYALDSISKRRSATAICSETNTILGFIPKDVYHENIFLKNQKNIQKNILMLNNINFFKKISNSEFKKNYFKLFMPKKYLKNEIFLECNKEIKEIYFIREGKVDVSLYLNIFEIETLFDEILNTIAKFQLTENDLKSLEQLKIEIISHYKFKKEQLENLKLKRNVNLFSLETLELIGLEPFLLKLKNFYKVTPVSEKLTVYGINVKNFEEILNDYPNCKQSFEKLALNKCFVILTRLNNIKNSILNLSNFKFDNISNNISNNLNYFDKNLFNNLYNSNQKEHSANKKPILNNFFESGNPQRGILNNKSSDYYRRNDQSTSFNYLDTNSNGKTYNIQLNQSYFLNDELNEHMIPQIKYSSSSLKNVTYSIRINKMFEKINENKEFPNIAQPKNKNFYNILYEQNEFINFNNKKDNSNLDFSILNQNNEIIPRLEFERIYEEKNKNSKYSNSIFDKNPTSRGMLDHKENNKNNNSCFDHNLNSSEKIQMINSIPIRLLNDKIKFNNYSLTDRDSNMNGHRGGDWIDYNFSSENNFTERDIINKKCEYTIKDCEYSTRSHMQKNDKKNITLNAHGLNNIKIFKEVTNIKKDLESDENYKKKKNKLIENQTLLEKSIMNSPKTKKENHENLFFFNIKNQEKFRDIVDNNSYSLDTKENQINSDNLNTFDNNTYGNQKENSNFYFSLEKKKLNLLGSLGKQNRYVSMIDLHKQINVNNTSSHSRANYTNEKIKSERNLSNLKFTNFYDSNFNMISNIYFNENDRQNVENSFIKYNKDFGRDLNNIISDNESLKNSSNFILYNNDNNSKCLINNNSNLKSDMNPLKENLTNKKIKRKLVIFNKSLKIKQEKKFGSEKTLLRSSSFKNEFTKEICHDQSFHVKQFDDVEFNSFIPKLNKFNNTLKNIQNLRNRIKESNVKKRMINKNKS